ncbi:MAG: glycine zipper 2TM domain-containing protein [Burkholderiales bacterium]
MRRFSLRTHGLGRPVYAMLLCFGTLPGVASADFEEVRIVRVEPVELQTCAPAPRTAQSQPPQRQPGAGITGTQILGGAAGAAVGGAVGNQFGSGSGKTAATIAGAGVGAYAGYKLTEGKPAQTPPKPAPKPGPLAQQEQVQCTIATRHRVEYARANGLVGEVMMTSKPTGPSLLMSFCGDAPCN